MRFLVAATLMTVLIVVGWIRIDLRGKDIRPVLLVSFWQPVMYFIMENTGLKYTSASEAGVMIASIPIVVAVLSSVILKERSNKIQIVFILMSIAGVLVMVLGDGSASNPTQLKGILLLLGAVFSASMYNIFSRKASVKFTPIEITYVMMCIGTIVFGVLYFSDCVIHSKAVITAISVDSITAILYLGIISSVVAFLFANYTLSRLPAAQSSVFANLTTVVSVIAGVIFRNESFGLTKIIGTLIIIIGVFGTNYFTEKKADEK